MRKLVLIMVVTILVSGCQIFKSEQTELEELLQAHYDEKPACILVRHNQRRTDGWHVDSALKTTSLWAHDHFGVLLEAWRKNGLLTRTEAEVETHRKEKLRGWEYRLTDSGRESLRLDDASIGACYGKREVRITGLEIGKDWSGQRAAVAKYEYQITGLPGWAKEPEVVKAIREVGAAVQSQEVPLKSSASYVQLETGWKLLGSLWG